MAYGDTALTTQPSGYVQDALNKPFAFSNTQAALNPGQLQQQAADTAYQSATRYLDPQFQRQQSGLESQLANQGITRGSEAWNNAMQEQYNWIIDQIAAGNVVLAYDRRICGKVHHLKDVRRVFYCGGQIWIDNKPATGWTFAVKPKGK